MGFTAHSGPDGDGVTSPHQPYLTVFIPPAFLLDCAANGGTRLQVDEVAAPPLRRQ